jgi:hypothetical protein
MPDVGYQESIDACEARLSDQKTRSLTSTLLLFSFFPIFVLLLLARAPDIIPPRLWAEDGSLFLREWTQHGFFSFFRPYAGYFHLVPRLSAAIAFGIFPAEWAVVCFTLIVVALTTYTGFILMRLLGSGVLGVIGGIALLFAPGWMEALGSVTNLQWVLAPGLLVLILKSRVLSTRESIGFVILASLSGPFSAIFLPISSYLLTRDFLRRETNPVVLAALLCGLIQLAAIIAMAAATHHSEAMRPLWLTARLMELSLSSAKWPFLAAALLCTTLLIGDQKLFRTGLAAGIALLTIALVIKFRHETSIFESGVIVQRYWYVQGVLWILIGISASSEAGLLRYWGGLALILTLLNLPAQGKSRTWPWKSDNWSQFVQSAKLAPTTFKYAPDWSMILDLRR